MTLTNLAREITEELIPSSLQVGKIVQHPDGYKVKIVDGEYWGRHGLSNFWSWRRVTENGTLSSKTECGYGW